LLSGLTTDNFWAYIGEQPTVWNAYVLGPTKPALFALNAEQTALVNEVAAAEAAPPMGQGTGWSVQVDLGSDLAWSDGVPITAEDLVFTFQTVRRLALQGGWAEVFPPEVEAVVAVSPTQVRIDFSGRPSLSVWPNGVGLAPIMPAHIWEPLLAEVTAAEALYAMSGDTDVSGGPLALEEIGEDRIVAVANPGYPETAWDRVEYHIYPDEASAVAELASGAIDTILSPTGLSDISLTALSEVQGVAISESPANSVRYLGFNLEREPMSSAPFREALALLLDRQQTAARVAPGADPAFTMISPFNETWFDEEAATEIEAVFGGTIDARLATALDSLRAAGYVWAKEPTVANGAIVAGEGLTISGLAPAPLTILTPGAEYDPDQPEYAGEIERTLELLGFTVSPVVTDFDSVVDLAFTAGDDGARHYDMYLLGWTLGNPSLPAYYRWFFAPDGPANSTGYSDPEFAAQLAEFEQASDLQVAKSALWQMERILAQDLPYLVLYHPEITEAYRSDRLDFGIRDVLGGIQGRLGGLVDLTTNP
ncbi:MAG TPA: ABC transporter substrate-binding protein, partial [Acidimicrobiia bacterium]|nr:ABC transporter substrate-binding protein [Acidimicrobiia bacterium]